MMDIPADDRGLHYGDGLFETILVREGKAMFARRHVTRLHRDAGRLVIPSPGIDPLIESVQAQAAKMDHGILKLILTRGSGGRGYQPPENPTPRILVTTHPLPGWPDTFSATGIAVRWCDMQLSRQPRLAGIKHLNRLEQVLARQEWRDMATWQEGLMCDTAGNVIEATQSNVFVVMGETLCTPALDQCGVAGIMRAMLLEAAAQLGLPTREASLSRADVLGANEVLVCNSVVGIWPVNQIGETRFAAPGPVTQRLQSWLARCDRS